MEAAEVVRAARQRLGASQRQIAALAGVPASVVAAIETGRTQPQWNTVMSMLAVAGLDVSLAVPSPPPPDELRSWLRLSTSERLYVSLGGTHSPRWDRHCAVWQQLRAAVQRRTLILEPEACLGIWLPHRPAPSPLPLRRIGMVEGPERDWPLLSIEPPRPRGESLGGLVPVGVNTLDEVLVLPPSAPELAFSPGTWTALRTAASLLDAERRRDLGGRRPPAHRVSNPRTEESRILTIRKWGDRPRETPDARYRRDWRLGGEASLLTWMARHGYPV